MCILHSHHISLLTGAVVSLLCLALPYRFQDSLGFLWCCVNLSCFCHALPQDSLHTPCAWIERSHWQGGSWQPSIRLAPTHPSQKSLDFRAPCIVFILLPCVRRLRWWQDSFVLHYRCWQQSCVRGLELSSAYQKEQNQPQGASRWCKYVGLFGVPRTAGMEWVPKAQKIMVPFTRFQYHKVHSYIWFCFTKARKTI